MRDDASQAHGEAPRVRSGYIRLVKAERAERWGSNSSGTLGRWTTQGFRFRSGAWLGIRSRMTDANDAHLADHARLAAQRTQELRRAMERGLSQHIR